MTRYRTIRYAGLVVAAVVTLLLATAPPLRAADTEGCLVCHQYRGLARVSSNGTDIRLFYVDPDYFNMALGPHARLRCTDCHQRSQVEVFPHQKPTPVDCSQTCHLTAPGQVEVRFSHRHIADMLGKSVHGNDALQQANRLLGSPLRDGQAVCLLCHDEPMFRRGGSNWVEQQTPLSRCATCHDEQLPVDTRHFYWHVVARSKPARTNQDLVRVCAVCHSNKAIRDQFNLPDAAASYLASFHGKATLLGSEQTANCLDCHAAQMSNVHLMLKHDDPAATTNPRNLPDTCRSPACHRAAGQKITSAAIHMDLASTHGIEFLIGCAFVFLIASTFGPSLLLAALKMLQIVVARRDPMHHHYHRMAEELLDDPTTRPKLIRFTAHQRVQHWYLVIAFVSLVITGFPIRFADRAWAAWIIGLFGGLPTARLVHRFAGAMLIFGLFYHLVYIAISVYRRQRTQKRPLIKTLLNLPMMITLNDVRQMNQLMMYLLGVRKARPEAGRFNPEEKFEYIGVFWGSFVLGVTGLLMWFNAWTTHYLPGRVLTIAILLHGFEAFLALLHVGVVHMVSVILQPGVFPISRAMFTGVTPTEELIEGHQEMLVDVHQQAHESSISSGVAAEAGHV